jgi:tetratricopeptide (TPR) repeat protein
MVGLKLLISLEENEEIIGEDEFEEGDEEGEEESEPPLPFEEAVKLGEVLLKEVNPRIDAGDIEGAKDLVQRSLEGIIKSSGDELIYEAGKFYYYLGDLILIGIENSNNLIGEAGIVPTDDKMGPPASTGATGVNGNNNQSDGGEEEKEQDPATAIPEEETDIQMAFENLQVAKQIYMNKDASFITIIDNEERKKQRKEVLNWRIIVSERIAQLHTAAECYAAAIEEYKLVLELYLSGGEDKETSRDVAMVYFQIALCYNNKIITTGK